MNWASGNHQHNSADYKFRGFDKILTVFSSLLDAVGEIVKGQVHGRSIRQMRQRRLRCARHDLQLHLATTPLPMVIGHK